MPEDDERPAPATEETGRDRLLATFRRPSRAQAVVGVLLAALGFSAVVQVNNNEQDNTYAGLREQDLVEILDALTGTAERARREVGRLERTRDEFQSESTSREAALSETQDRVKTLNIIAGLVPVTGPGIRVRIEEVRGQVTLTSLLDLVQELRTADAEAMEFNDTYRLAAQSSFDNAVGGISLDGQLLEPPYVVDIIGEPHALHSAMTFDDGPIEQLEEDGATVQVTELDSLDIESVRTPVRPVDAQADTGQ
ncbi:DUF881 domain-containing protein [Nocardioides currus]|uniref:DUF881 domain-containing protein n=1 Tax=Nocardioides currus TaxID=2133958 RepID=A0A2R7YS65_9ACTN|nr:DUF881 domain-containing protein [Nocardioides currus]PUA79255.1 DUF881 domain-containing protein [Nocardioides currus]